MFIPDRVLVERKALQYSEGNAMLKSLRQLGVTDIQISETGRFPGEKKGPDPAADYERAKKTLMLAVRKRLAFQTCKPSADYQLPLVTSCPGRCEYCYLQTTLGPRPRIKVYANLKDVLRSTAAYMEKRHPEKTVFEASAVGDPVAVEPYSGLLARSIEFFGGQVSGRLRIATKFDDIEGLLSLNHRGHTHFRFSVNARSVTQQFEQGAPNLERRIKAARLLAEKGYPVGFLVAPVMDFEGWQQEYEELARSLAREMAGIPNAPASLEFISHRFTARAKACILARNPHTRLPMDEEKRVLKMGQFGYTKYLYPKERLTEIKRYITDLFQRHLPQAAVEYFV